MRDKFNKFMQGRYGVDELSRFTMGAALVLIILTMFITMFNRNLGSIFDFLGIAAIVYAYFQLPGLWTEGPYSQGERQDRDRMSEMPHEIRKEELKCSDM